MSHFSVIVIGPDYEKQLAPYHEFECTGIDDEHVIEVDDTDKMRAEYLARKTTRYRNLATGELETPWTAEGDFRDGWYEEEPDPLFKVKQKKLKVPDGYEAVELACSEVESFAEWLKDWTSRPIVYEGEEPGKFGSIFVDANGEVVKTIDRTNPERKWDWYQVGGRWSGYFKIKAGAHGLLGDRSLLDHSPDDRDGWADQLRKGDIDIDGMRLDADTKARESWTKFQTVLNSRPIIDWPTCQRNNGIDPDKGYDQPGFRENIDLARAAWNNQEAVKDLRKEGFWEFDHFLTDIDTFAQRARDNALVSFAVVKDGKWYERGQMGWWGMVHDEKDKDSWQKEFTKLFDSLPDDTLITVVDCHI
jgi:hypothetical protein